MNYDFLKKAFNIKSPSETENPNPEYVPPGCAASVSGATVVKVDLLGGDYRMSKPKFKVGDKVRINRNARKNSVPRRYIGVEGEIVETGTWRLLVKVPKRDLPLVVTEKAIDLIRPEKIIIYRNGAEVVAKNTATGKTGVAKCNPADEFDFNTGAKLAFERLTNPEPEKPKYYTGKVVCVSAFSDFFTKGKVYEIKDGVGKDDEGTQITHKPVKSFKEFNQKMVSEFIELVE